jgi:hypothetical protein
VKVVRRWTGPRRNQRAVRATYFFAPALFSRRALGVLVQNGSQQPKPMPFQSMNPASGRSVTSGSYAGSGPEYLVRVFAGHMGHGVAQARVTHGFLLC